jgi:integrase/recombinase XerC
MRWTTVTTLTRESIEQHRSWLTAQAASPHTARCYHSDLMGFLMDNPAAEGMEIRDPRLEFKAMDWLNEGRKVWKPKTTQRRRTALRSFAKYLGHPEFLALYRTPTAARGDAHPIMGGVDAINKMIIAAQTPQHRCLIALCGLAGLRVNEAVTVGASDVNVELRMLTVHGKGAKDRYVPISSRAWPWVLSAYSAALLGGYKPLVPMAERTARQAITTIGKRAGLGHVASHDLRMTFGTAAYAATKDLRVVQELLGHASSKTTETYTGISTAAMRAAVEL